MTKRETINEMANVVPEKIKDPLDNSRYIIFGKSLRREIARIYYNAGYRKIDEFSECRNCTAWHCILGNANNVRDVHASGALGDNVAYSAFGVVPACIFKDIKEYEK